MKLTVNQQNEIARMLAMRMLGSTYGGARNVYDACGYRQTITLQDYADRYERCGVSARVVEAFPDSCWRSIPEIYETEDIDEETPFEKDWKRLTGQLNDTGGDTIHVFELLHKVDCLAGVGQYGVLLYGLDDGNQFDKPVRGKNHQLLYLQAYMETAAGIVDFISNPKTAKYGWPAMYTIDLMDAAKQTGASVSNKRTKTQRVHSSRVLHVPSDRSTSHPAFGTPRMKRVFNALEDLEKVLGSGAEGWWRNAFQKIQLDVRDNAEFTEEDAQAVDKELKKFIHDMQSFIRTKGIDIKPMPTMAKDPKGMMDALFDYIAASTQIPKRVLTGTEQAELAGEKDDENYKSRVIERRRRYSESKILRPFVDNMISLGVLTKPKQGYMIDWKDETEMTEEDRVVLAKTRVETAKAYIEGNVEQIYPLDHFLGTVMGMEPAEIEEIRKTVDEEREEEDDSEQTEE
jgi:hypothetical protein